MAWVEEHRHFVADAMDVLATHIPDVEPEHVVALFGPSFMRTVPRGAPRWCDGDWEDDDGLPSTPPLAYHKTLPGGWVELRRSPPAPPVPAPVSEPVKPAPLPPGSRWSAVVARQVPATTTPVQDDPEEVDDDETDVSTLPEEEDDVSAYCDLLETLDALRTQHSFPAQVSDRRTVARLLTLLR